MRRSLITLLLSLSAALAALAPAANAMVVHDADGNTLGVRFQPNTAPPASMIQTPGIPGACDPWLSSDLLQPASGLCWHGGPVLHRNETFTLIWDPMRRYWSTVQGYVQQFLRDVADDSGKLTNPYAVTTQYSDSGGRAAYASVYGGGCIDHGVQGGFACRFINSDGSGAGRDYGANGCKPSGGNPYTLLEDGSVVGKANDVCVTDAQIRAEVSAGSGVIASHANAGTPVVTVLLPPNVQVCLDSSATVCSANDDPIHFPGGTAKQFCSYHGEVAGLAYVVQPWTAGSLACDDPNAPDIPNPLPPVDVLAKDLGARLVSPLSQSHIAAIVNPGLDGWFSSTGEEIDDWGARYAAATPPHFFGCQPLGNGLDKTTVGASGQSAYLLQREFNNAGAIESDANAPGCAPNVLLDPVFVVPSQVNPGDVVEFDGSASASTLIIPRDQYRWDFGDTAAAAAGPSATHAYTAAGTYTVKLTVTDRGGNTAVSEQTVSVGHGANQPPANLGGLHIRVQMLPQSLRSMLTRGALIRVTSNEAADGIIALSIPAAAARRAHLRVARHLSAVTVARGTVSGISNGRTVLRVRMAGPVAHQLLRLNHLTLTVRLALVASAHDRLAVDIAGRY
jgi:hypothetical protein